MLVRSVVVASATAACFSPQYSSPRCNASGECPAGLTCNAQLECVAHLDEAGVPTDVQDDAPADVPIDMPIDANLNRLAFDLVLRDFRGIDLNPPGHPDFEAPPTGNTVVPGLVQSELVNGKPVLSTSHPTIQSVNSFSHWFADTAQNMKFTDPILLERIGGRFTYSHAQFFPLDGRGFTNAGTEPVRMGHNFSFTTEAHIPFTFTGGERISFTGDDDVWIFVNGHLLIDLGGMHIAASGSVTLTPGVATSIGLVAGQQATISVFQAERHTTGSSYQLTLEGLVP